MEFPPVSQLPWAVGHDRFLAAAEAITGEGACCLFVIDEAIPASARSGYAALVIAYARANEPVTILEGGAAALLIGLAFTLLAFVQDRSLKSKRRGALWDLIPSLSVCRMVGYRALAIGFSIYTLGLIAGVIWSYRTRADLMVPSAKEIGAILAWIFFAILLQSFISGAYHARRTIFFSAGAFVSIIVAILGIAHG